MASNGYFGEWKDLCLSYHFDDRIRWEYKSDGLYDVGGCAIFDVDKTITRGRTLTQNVLDELYKDNEVSKRSRRIDEDLRALAENPFGVKAVFDDIFLGALKGVLKESAYKDACLDAADRTLTALNTRGMMLDIRDRGIERAVLTYGFEDALVPWYEYKVGVPAQKRGIRMIFRNGLLAGYDMAGPYGKVSYAQHLTRSLGFDPDRILAVTDDPIVDKAMAVMLGIGFVVWTDSDKQRRELAAGGMYKYPGKAHAVLAGIEDDARVVTREVDKWCRARFISEAVPPSRITALDGEFKKMGRSLEICSSDKQPRERIRDFAMSGERLLSAGNPFIATTTNGIDGLMSDLRLKLYSGAEMKELVELADSIYSTLRAQNPELQLTEDHIEKIRRFA